MKNAIRWAPWIVLLMGLVAGKKCVATELFFEPLKISIALPSASLATDDLDARDEFNRPLRSQKIQTHFEQLWICSLNRMILLSLTPGRVQMLALLNSLWDRFVASLRTSSQETWKNFKAWIQTKKQELHLRLSQTQHQHVRIFSVSSHRQFGTPFLFLLQSMISSTRLLR